jgi:hypothetical protein
MTDPVLISQATDEALAGRRADQNAWHTWNTLQRAARDAQAVLSDPKVGPQWRAQVLNACRQVGAVASDQED